MRRVTGGRCPVGLVLCFVGHLSFPLVARGSAASFSFWSSWAERIIVFTPAAKPSNVNTTIIHGALPDKRIQPVADAETDPQTGHKLYHHPPRVLRHRIVLLGVGFAAVLPGLQTLQPLFNPFKRSGSGPSDITTPHVRFGRNLGRGGPVST